MKKHRLIVVAYGLIFIVAALAFLWRPLIPDPILAILGIAIFLMCLGSPVLVFYCVSGIKSGNSESIDFICLVVSIIFLVLVFYGVWKLWPALMGI